MPYCPKCSAEFPSELSVCPLCARPQVRTPASEPDQGELFEVVELYRLPDEVAGLALKSYLADAGIHATLQEMRASFYGNTLNPGGGYWGKVLVDKRREPEARKLLAVFLREFGGS